MDIKHFVERACRDWYKAGIEPGQYDWDKLVEIGDDPRLEKWRKQMKAALDAVGFFELVVHHAAHHKDLTEPTLS